MAFVLPNAIGTADYAQPLLAYLRHRFARIELIHLGERLFIQAGADERISLLLLDGYVPDGVAAMAPLQVRNVANIGEALASEGTHLGLNQKQNEPDVLEVASDALKNMLGVALVTLGSVAKIRIGEVVGDIPYFVRSMEEWEQKRIGSGNLVQLLTRSAQVRGLYLRKSKNPKVGAPIPYLLLPPTKGQSKPVKRYLDQYPQSDIDENRTFQKRTIWYRCSYEKSADAFIGSISHDYPRIIGNNAKISCSNAFYKINVETQTEFADWLPILSLTTPLRLSAEVRGRVRGSGGIKLEPSDVAQLCIPIKVPTMTKDQFRSLRERLNEMICQGELDAASQLADARIFLDPGLIDSQMMAKLWSMRSLLTNRRLSRPK